jgi:hypothetical protein
MAGFGNYELMIDIHRVLFSFKYIVLWISESVSLKVLLLHHTGLSNWNLPGLILLICKRYSAGLLLPIFLGLLLLPLSMTNLG